MPLHVAHFVPRYPPALGGAEVYACRLSEYLAGCGDAVTVWTTTAVELGEMWYGPAKENGKRVPPHPAGELALTAPTSPTRGQVRAGWSDSQDGKTNSTPPPPSWGRSASGVEDDARRVGGHPTIRRYPPLGFPFRRYLLKTLSLLPVRTLQALAQPVNPICPGLWRDAANYHGPLDAVHAFAFPYAFPIVCALRLARRRRVPFLLTPFLHLGDPTDPRDRTRRQYTRPHLRWLLREADAVFVQTESERRAVVEIGVREDRAVLQGLGVDPAECTGGDRLRARCQWGVSDVDVVVGHLANNSVEKGTVDLLMAAGQANVRVVLAGPEMPNFRAFWDTFPRQDLVTRLGPLTDDQKRDFFAGIDAFALPSRTDSFGLVLLEAWANGKPVLAYRAGGPADLISHGVDGLLAKCGDVPELAERLRELAASAEFRAKLGVAGRGRVADEFRWADKLAVVRETMARLIPARS